MLYKGHKIVPYCPRCGTPLSSHEVAQGYKDVKERSAIAKFKVKDEDAYILAWTTTPWTLPSNVALCVNPNETYVKVKAADGYTYYMAEALLDKVLGKLKTEAFAEILNEESEKLGTPFIIDKLPSDSFFINENEWFQATFFYESMWNLMAFLLLIYLLRIFYFLDHHTIYHCYNILDHLNKFYLY